MADLTEAQRESRTPTLKPGESLASFLDRTWHNFHEQAIPRYRVRYLLTAADRAIDVLDRVATALERIADAVGRVEGSTKIDG